jgi:thymidine kinase
MADAEAHLIVGPMYSGKSSHLIATVLRHRSIGVPVLVIKPTIDVRSGEIGTHILGGTRIECVLIDPQHWDVLWERPDYQEAVLVCVDEVQFFQDSIVDGLKRMLDDNKRVYMYGLDGSAEQKSMWPLQEVVPLCNKVEKLNAMCTCGMEAPFTVCDTPLPEDGVLVDAGESDVNYMSMCRKCLLGWQNHT